MDAKEIGEAFKNIASLAKESAEDSKLVTERLKKVEGFLIAEKDISEQASQALSSFRLLRYWRLRRESRKLVLQAVAFLKIPAEISERSQARLSHSKALEDSARKMSQ